MSGWLARADLTEVELTLVDRAMFGDEWAPDKGKDSVAHGAEWGADRTVRAQVLHQVLTGRGVLYDKAAVPDGVSAPRSIQARNLRITGELNLDGANLGCPLYLASCYFDSELPVQLRWATATSIVLRRCWFPSGIRAQSLSASRVDFSHAHVEEMTHMAGARIAKDLDLTRGDYGRGRKGRGAIDLEGLQVGGSMLCEGVSANGRIYLVGAHIGGRLDLSGTTVARGSIIARHLKVDGDMNCRRVTTDEMLVLHRAQVGGALDFTASTLGKGSGRGGTTALDARELQVKGDMSLHEKFRAVGQVTLRNAQIAGELYLTGGAFDSPGGTAVDAGRLRVGGSMIGGRQLSVNGALRMVSAHIGASLKLERCSLQCEQAWALSADGAQIDGDVYLGDRFHADGGVRLLNARIGGGLYVSGEFTNGHPNPAYPDIGNVVFILHRLTARVVYFQPARVDGILDLSYASVALWADNEVGRASPTILRRTRYDWIAPGPDQVAIDERLEWLRRDPAGYSPGAYAQLASIYRSSGNDHEARTVLIASEHDRLQTQGRIAQAWGALLNLTVGYGFRPWRALWWLIGLIAVGSTIVSLLPPESFEAGADAPPRNAVLYTLDTLLPIGDFRYNAWVPASAASQIVTALIVLFGYVLATAVIAAFAGILRRGD